MKYCKDGDKKNIVDSLIEKAKNIALLSYSPYSKFRVGASLLTEDGKIFCGTNVENSSYGGTICAERSAIVSAISNGYKKFKMICIVALDYEEYIYPCGICLQFISEFGSDIDIVITNKILEYKILKISDFLPLNFSLKK